jgi:hypothetical protein
LFFCSYGARIGLVQDQTNSQQNLIRLLKALKTHLKQRTVLPSSLNVNNKTSTPTSTNPTLANLIAVSAVDNNGNRLSILTDFDSSNIDSFVYVDYTTLLDAYPGFDWFSTSIFLLMGCDDVRSWRWLRTFSLLLPAGFLWHARLFNTVYKIYFEVFVLK